MTEELMNQDPNLEAAPEAEIDTADAQAVDEAVEGSLEGQEAQPSKIQGLMSKKNWETEDDVASAYEALEREKSRLARELARFRRAPQQNEPQQQANDLPSDTQEWLQQFATNPNQVMSKAIERAVKPYVEKINQMEQEQAVNYIVNQNDYNEDALGEIEDILYDRAEDLYRFNNVNVPLKDLPPMTKARVALNLWRETKKSTKQTTKSLKPQTVVQTKKSGTKQSGKQVEAMTTDEMMKAFPQLSRVGDL